MTQATLKVAVAQFPGTNKIDENKKYISELSQQAAERGVELLVFPEAAMCSFSSDLADLQAIATEHSPAFIEFICSETWAASFTRVGKATKPGLPLPMVTFTTLLVLNLPSRSTPRTL